MDKKNLFYIFLDIDGVLWDWDWRLKAIDKGLITKTHYICDFNPKSIEALNLLTEKLEENNDVKLVITSTWRSDLDFTKEVFDKHKLNYNDELLATKITGHPEKRGLEILDFLNSHDKGDFVIIDDESFDYKNHFSNNKIIKTSLYDNSLSSKHINSWLEKHPELTGQSEEKEF